MIPKKLQIKNFLSYGPETQTIDFLPYNLICLSGKNGHGKSALLDAITWVLWGQARKTTGTSKADEGLVHLGQKHMLVTFDFEINNTTYRVRREFVKTKSTPFSALDFGIIKSDQSCTTLTDKTIKLTQTKLEKTIGITFESFINSAFLRQGQANEFSKKSPKERKDILATILQLDRFEDLKKHALDKIKNIQQDILQKQTIYNRIDLEINELKTALIHKEEHTKQLQIAQKEYTHLQEKIHEDEQKKAYLLDVHKTYEIIHIQKKELEKQLSDIEQQINNLEKVYKKIASEQSTKIDIIHLEKEQERLRTVILEHQEKLHKRLELKDQYLSLQEKKQALEKEIHQERIQLTQKYELKSNILHEQIKQNQEEVIIEEKKLKNLSDQLSIQQNTIVSYEKQIAEQTIILNTYQAYEKSFEKDKNQYQIYQTQATMLEEHIQNFTQKHILYINNKKSLCPLCEQNLPASQQKTLEEKLEHDLNIQKNELEKISAEKTKLKKTLIEKHAIIEDHKKNQDNYNKLISQIESIKEQTQKLIEHIQDQQKQIIARKTKLKELYKEKTENEQNVKKAYSNKETEKKEIAYETLIKKIDILKQAAQTLGYKKEDHEIDLKQLQEIDTVLNNYKTIQKEIAQQEQRLKQINDLKIVYEKITLSCSKLTEKLETIKDCPNQLTHHLELEKQHKQAIHIQHSILSDLLNKNGIFDLQQKKLIALEQEYIVIEKEIKLLNLECIDFTEISKALGKDGLQALLIEQALPEIEQEANILLSQLTDNQTQIFIESLRDLKKGGSKETLDIKISDAIGLRPYEMFSGGEAFRIDFALRIAISKLLARRAGTALQTLIIDEGFGSQDDEGLQLIMDNILKIQDNFAKIIIVSHLPSMKEQFPVQFLVQKKASGSTITVIHQG